MMTSRDNTMWRIKSAPQSPSGPQMTLHGVPKMSQIGVKIDEILNDNLLSIIMSA